MRVSRSSLWGPKASVPYNSFFHSCMHAFILQLCFEHLQCARNHTVGGTRATKVGRADVPVFWGPQASKRDDVTQMVAHLSTPVPRLHLWQSTIVLESTIVSHGKQWEANWTWGIITLIRKDILEERNATPLNLVWDQVPECPPPLILWTPPHQDINMQTCSSPKPALQIGWFISSDLHPQKGGIEMPSQGCHLN